MRRQSEAGKQAVERRLREDEAERLAEVVPDLVELSVAIDERVPGDPSRDVSHIRRIVIEHAPAHFEFGCCDRTCNGGHDLTAAFLRALRRRRETFEGSDPCGGEAKEGPCRFVLHYQATARYREASSRSPSSS